jgi:hypothetical protein
LLMLPTGGPKHPTYRRTKYCVLVTLDVPQRAGAALANSALNRLANGAHQLVIEGPSYRARLAPRPPAESPMT